MTSTECIKKIQDYTKALMIAVTALQEQERQKWIRTRDHFPEESGEYIVLHDGSRSILHYSAIHKAFNCYDSFSKQDAEKCEIVCTHWMRAPELPVKKG